MKNKELQTAVKETELKLKEAISLPEVSNVLIQLIQQFDSKVELHVHFNIQSIGNVTDSTVIGNINGDNNTTIAGYFSDSNVANTVTNGYINGNFSEYRKQVAENSNRINKQIKELEKQLNQ